MHSFSRCSTVCLALALSLAACSDPEKLPYVPPDAGPKLDGRQLFLAPCLADSDCASGHCLQLGESRRCTKACDSELACPALGGWRCGATGLCVCNSTGKEPDICNWDGDCDGQPDKEVKAESCNGEDDDCNGKIDDVAPNTPGAKLYYRDADGDTFGDPENQLWSCKPVTGYVENKGDCDDSRKDTNPDAVEQCGDDLDHDCDGFKWDADVCGYLPILVPDVNGSSPSASLKDCGATPGIDPSLDITEIVGKQDTTLIKFTVRLAGAPATDKCSSYVLRLGTFSKVYVVAYVYRPATLACAGLPELEAFIKGAKVSTKAAVGFNAASPGHVSFTIPKTEYFPSVSSPGGPPVYYLKACTNSAADAIKDLTDCVSDSCETPVRRD